MSEKLKAVELVELRGETPSVTVSRRTTGDVQNVLLVEDDQDVRQLLRDAGAAAGHRVAEAGTLADAEALLSQDTFDFLVVDAKLPDGRGVDLGVQAAHEGMKVVIISGNSAEMDRMRRDKILYLGKPFRPADLARLIDRFARNAKREAC